jgi:Zn-dependent protease with chaperone function
MSPLGMTEIRGGFGMAAAKNTRVGLSKAAIYCLLSLFLIPAIAYGFVSYAFTDWDKAYTESLNAALGKAQDIPADRKEAVKQYNLANFAPSKICGVEPNNEAIKQRQEKQCGYSEAFGQFYIVELVSFWTLVAGAGILALILVLCSIAFINRRALYLSFLFSRHFLTVVTALEVIVQGALLLWLSYWLTAYFLERISLKIVALAAITTGLAAIFAVMRLFKRVKISNQVEGEILTLESEPVLWTRVKSIAAKMETTPPDFIVAGIDDNFFVSQSPMIVNGQELKGRILFISVPLLRILDEKEADAILAHELAHFRGGDTKSSAQLGPKLRQFGAYMADVSELHIGYVLWLYRLVLEFALKRESRLREFIADRAAAKTISAEALVHSLIKVSAYSGYRAEIENQLFSLDEGHSGPLGIAAKVASGLNAFALSPRFIQNMRLISVPHPFDSHPPLSERMRNAGCVIGESSFAAIATENPRQTWVYSIQSSDAIETKLWSKYEQQFTANHELDLAYRYEPATEQEKAVVLKYFPPVKIQLRKNSFEIHYWGLLLSKPVSHAKDGRVPWDDITNLTIQNNYAVRHLVIMHKNRGRFFLKQFSITLFGIGNQYDQMVATLNRYRQRHLIMRQYKSAAMPEVAA